MKFDRHPDSYHYAEQYCVTTYSSRPDSVIPVSIVATRYVPQFDIDIGGVDVETPTTGHFEADPVGTHAAAHNIMDAVSSLNLRSDISVQVSVRQIGAVIDVPVARPALDSLDDDPEVDYPREKIAYWLASALEHNIPFGHAAEALRSWDFQDEDVVDGGPLFRPIPLSIDEARHHHTEIRGLDAHDDDSGVGE